VLGILLAVQPALFAQGAPARLAHAIDKFEAGKYSEAIQELKAIQPQLPKLADYVALYLASSRVELKDFEQARKDLAVFHNLSAPSPLGAKAALVEAKALTETGSASGAAVLLRERYSELPQPSTDFALAQAYEAAQDPAQAATYYQRVYYLYPLSDLAPRAAKAMDALRAAMGSSYPPPMPEQMLERGAGYWRLAHIPRRAPNSSRWFRNWGARNGRLPACGPARWITWKKRPSVRAAICSRLRSLRRRPMRRGCTMPPNARVI